ncbi:Sua5/YciO/YrdC/YwlC family protein [[Mycoplasma] collis]|uniref:Sua5/YciO/YrdC/YwlC family protein n=1 Tax=[Mycoplasma] collis TaxID=2127 RepID=UPI00051B05A5|nr:Sua5/YciO/YrdC/YwlC family protein [[Mycoplasma] collis]
MRKIKDKYKNLFITTTDTVVGIGVPIKNNELHLLYEIKKRGLNKKIIILVASIEQARKFKEWTIKAELLANKYWPGAVTLISKNQGFRMPNSKKLLNLLEKKGPCYVTSANISGEDNLTFEQAIKKFDMIKQVYNFEKGSNVASKIINVENMEVLRDGK